MTDVTACIERAARLLRKSSNVVVTTGAGMSKESGIPTFRDAPNALWKDYDPQQLATREGFRRDPALVWRWYADRRAMIAGARPHAGHMALAEMESMFARFILITQNIDNLHRSAGSTNLVELHGNIFRFKCFDNDHPVEAPEAVDEPPTCACGSLVRPAVVWFGEILDDSDLARSFEALESCHAIIVVGTSGLVYPAAGFAAAARSAGAAIVEINPEETTLTAQADVFVPSTAGSALPMLVERLRG